MVKSKNILFIIILISSLSYSQIDLNRVSINGGFVRNYRTSVMTETTHSFVSQFSIGGDFFIKKLQWTVFVNYWKDDNSSLGNTIDFIEYSYKTFEIGFDFQYNFLKKEILFADHRFNLLIGLLNQNIDREYIKGLGLNGKAGTDDNSNYINLKYGISDRIKISKIFDLNISFYFMENLEKELTDRQYAFLTGLVYKF